MSIRENLIRTYVREALEIEKARTKLRPITTRLTDEEFQIARVAVLEEHLAWLKAGCPDDIEDPDKTVCRYGDCSEGCFIGPVCEAHYNLFRREDPPGDLESWLASKE